MKYVQGNDVAEAAAYEGASRCFLRVSGSWCGVPSIIRCVYQAGREEDCAWALGRIAVPLEGGGT